MSQIAIETPANQRNTIPIIKELGPFIRKDQRLLEVASGYGAHCYALSKAFPSCTFQPSEIDLEKHDSIKAWQATLQSEFPKKKILPPLRLDMCQTRWPEQLGGSHFDWIIAINLIHIAPWEAVIGLFSGARSLGQNNGVILYGPFLTPFPSPYESLESAPSNLDFSKKLTEENPQWGVRSGLNVKNLAASFGFNLKEMIQMPSNNWIFIFKSI